MHPTGRARLASGHLVVEAVPLTRADFAPFGDVIENARPLVHPSAALPPSLPFGAVAANQGSAIKYQHVSRPLDLYDQAPSGRRAVPVLSVFVCAARARAPITDPPPAGPAPAMTPTPASVSAPAAAADAARTRDSSSQPLLPRTFTVSVLERHPFTTQTFIPLAAGPGTRYLVVVAPTLPCAAAAGDDDHGAWPAPSCLPAGADYPRPLPGRGMPDLRRLRAFVATGAQAVTYGAGTWHAPMVALGPDGRAAVDFVVAQFANGVPVEDCQEVFLESPEPAGPSPSVPGAGGIQIRLGPSEREDGPDPTRAKL